MMPGEPNVRPWLLLMYRDNTKFPEPEKYWNNAGKEMYNEYLKAAIKPNDDVRRAAAAAWRVLPTTTEGCGLVQYLRRTSRLFWSASHGRGAVQDPEGHAAQTGCAPRRRF